MRLNFKRIAAIAASTVMLGSTLGFAAAANYPAPFVSGSSANVAIIVGTGAGVNALDTTYAGNIKTDLNAALPGTVGAPSGESYLFEKPKTKWHLGDGLDKVISLTINDQELPTLLADGKFIDDDNDEFDYTQSILMSNLTVTMFEHNDYNDDAPAVATKIASGAHVLNYTLDFTENPLWADLTTSDLPLLGKEYYVLSNTVNTTLTLLDSAGTATVSEGETVTVTAGGKSYDVAIAFIGTSEVKLDINGETTNSLGEGASGTQKLADGSYIGVKDISVQDYAGGTKQVEFGIGAGKLKLTHDTEVELNDDAIEDVKSYFASSLEALTEITIQWRAEDELFIGPDRVEILPGFGVLQLSTTGMEYPIEEEIVVDAGSDTYIQLDDFPLLDGAVDIPIAYGNTTSYVYTGKDADELLMTTNNSAFLLNESAHTEYFIASWSDGRDAESYYMKASSFAYESNTPKVTIQYADNGGWTNAKDKAVDDDTISIGNIEFTVTGINKTLEIVNITAGTNVEFDTIYSAEGAKIYLPFVDASGTSEDPMAMNTTTTTASVSGALTESVILSEEDENDNIGAGENVTLTLSFNSADSPETSVETVSGGGTTREKIGDSDTYRTFVYSALATEIFEDESADKESVTLTYHGDEAKANVYISEVGTSGGGADQLGDIILDDTEYSGLAAGKNAIIVGGSCINSAAASVLGVPVGTCGADFEAKVGIGVGEALIKSVDRGTDAIALVVAGYDVSDTQKAQLYLTTQTVNTAAGESLKVTSATSAVAMTA